MGLYSDIYVMTGKRYCLGAAPGTFRLGLRGGRSVTIWLVQT
jgi:hypothetical protein